MRKYKDKSFTAMFIKKDGSSRTMVAKWYPDQPKAKLGYVTVEDQVKLGAVTNPTEAIRMINMQTLYELIVCGRHYRVY